MKKSTIVIIVVIAIVGMGGLLLATRNKPGDRAPSSHDMGNTTSNSSSSNEKTTANQVTIKNFAFGPKNIKVKKGTKVTWTNQDAAHHDVTPDTEGPAFSNVKL